MKNHSKGRIEWVKSIRYCLNYVVNSRSAFVNPIERGPYLREHEI